MKSLNKKSVKGRGLVKTAVFICYMFTMVFISMMFARGEPARAGTPSEFKAFCWENREKFFKLLDTGSESNAPKYSLYQAKFKRDNSTVYLENGKSIDLDERCNKKESDGSTSPYRYWFWVRANKKASTSITWRTDSYIATGEPIDESVYNAKEYVNSDKVVSVAIDRKSAKSHNNSFYVNNGKVVNGYELDFYIIDIKEWYNKGGAYDANGSYADGFHGYLYMQSVIGVYHGGVHNKGPYYTLSSWKGAEGWADTSEFHNHYNQVLHIDKDGVHDTYFYRVLADEEKPVYGHCNSKDKGGVVLSGAYNLHGSSGECKQRIRNYSAFQLKDIGTYKCGGDTYYLKGIAVYPHEVTIDDKGNPQRSFYLTNSVKDKVYGADGNKETNEYSKFRGTGAKKDKLSNMSYVVTNAMEFSGAATQFKKQNVKQGGSDGKMLNNPGHFTGEKKVKDLRKRMENYWFKSGCEAQDVYLVYESSNSAEISVTAEYYNHDDDKSAGTGLPEYVLADQKDPKVIGKLTGDDNKFDLKIARKKEKEKILNTAKFKDIDYDSLTGDEKKKTDQKIDENRALNTCSKHNGVMYTARSVVVSYTNKSGKETYAYLDGSTVSKSSEEPGIADTSLDEVVKSASSNKFDDAVWSGKTAEQGELLTAIGKALDKLQITDMDKSKDVGIKVRYYQPQLPAMKLSYLKYEDNSGEKHSLLVSADKEADLKEVFCNNGEGSGGTERFGSYEYASAVTAYKDKATGMLYTKSGLGELGVSVSDKGFSKKYETVNVPLNNTFAFMGTVEGYHGQSGDSWLNIDGKPKSVDVLFSNKKDLLDSTLSGNTLTFNTDFKGSVAVGVYGLPPSADKPSYIAHIHYGMTTGNPSFNPPSSCSKDRDAISWDEKTYEGEAKELEDGSFAAVFKQALTLDYMGVDVDEPGKYGYIKGYAQCTDGAGHVTSGPPKGFSLETFKAKKTTGKGVQGSAEDTSGYVTKMKWAAGNTDFVELHVYYLMFTSKPGGGGDGHTTTTDKTEWNDVPDGMGTEFGDGPLYYSESENCEIKGFTDLFKPAEGKSGVNAASGSGQNVTSVYHVTNDLRLGQMSSLILPNGIKNWGEGGSYVPNQLESRMTATAYQSQGEMAKHTDSRSKTITFEWTVYTCIPTLYGHTHGSYPDSVDITISWENIWCSLDKVAVWEAKKTKMLNYAFPNSTDGHKENLDPDGDTRTPLQEKWQQGKKDYFVYLDRTIEKWRNYPSLGEDEDECEYGIAYNEYSKRVEEEALPALQAYVDGLPDSVHTGGYGCCHRSTAEAVPDAYEKAQSFADAGVAAYKDKFKSDVLIFVHPDFEDEVAGQVDRILTKDMNSIRTSLNGSRFKDYGDTPFLTMDSLDIKELRINQSKMSKEDAFKKDGIKIHQSKLNTKEDMEGPEPDSRAAVMYKRTGVALGGAGEPEEGWFYADDINKIVLHTPVSLNVTIERYAKNQVQNTRTFFTESNYEGGPVYNGDMPMPHDGEPLVLGAPFTMRLHYTGDFTNVDYGNPDTEPYVLEEDTAYFVFPYPVYVKDAGGSVLYHEKDTEFKLKDVRKCIFYPAYWTEEKAYDIDVQAEALNVIGIDDMEGIQDRKDRVCDCRNTARDFYRVRFLKRCTVVGILTNLRITDVADYPYLEKLFRTSGYTKSGFAIHSGSTTFNQYKYSSGESATYPVVEGQTLGYLKYGVFKPGYKVRFNVDTIATMEDRNDEIRITPTYYWIPKKPVTGAFLPADPVPVKVYYDEMEGTTQSLVEVGSALDLSNLHQLCIGDREHDAALRDLTDTAQLQGYEKLEDLTGMIADAWTYYHVTIPGNMRVNEGIKNSELLSWSYNYDWDGDSVRTKLPIPDTVKDTARLNNCLQDWYGEYYLPDKIYVRLADSASDTKFAQDAVAGYDFKEDYWCHDGYLVVNFNLTSYKNDTPHLAYNARDKNTEGDKLGYDPGFGDMWEIEDRAATKTDSWLQKFNFREGDFILYDLDASMSSDYKSGGTH